MRALWLILLLWTTLWPVALGTAHDAEQRLEAGMPNEQAVLLLRDRASKPSAVVHRGPLPAPLMCDLGPARSRSGEPAPRQIWQTAEGEHAEVALDTRTARGPPRAHS